MGLSAPPLPLCHQPCWHQHITCPHRSPYVPTWATAAGCPKLRTGSAGWGGGRGFVPKWGLGVLVGGQRGCPTVSSTTWVAPPDATTAQARGADVAVRVVPCPAPFQLSPLSPGHAPGVTTPWESRATGGNMVSAALS